MHTLKHITAEQKAQVGALIYSKEAPHGTISAICRQLECSHAVVYQWAKRIANTVTQIFVTEPHQKLHFDLCRSVLVLYVEAHASVAGIQECLQQMYNTHVSLGQIHEIIAQASKRAQAHLPKMSPKQPVDVALDEIFGRGSDRAYLNIVDVHSQMVLASSGPHHLDGDTWQLVLYDTEERGVDFNVTISDGGTALTCAVAEFFPDRLHRRDVWHIFNAVGKLLRKLVPLRCKQRQLLELKDKLSYLISELRELVEVVVMRKERVMSLSERMQEIDVVFELWQELEATTTQQKAPLLTQMRQKFAGIFDEMLAFAVDLEELQDEVRLNCGEEALAFLGWVWQRREQLGTPEQVLLGLPQPWQEQAKKLFWAWSGSVRASAAVENWHSILRPHLAVHRKLNCGQLALLSVWHNYHVFKRGEHMGKSPLQLAGVISEPIDWLVALGYPPAYLNA